MYAARDTYLLAELVTAALSAGERERGRKRGVLSEIQSYTCFCASKGVKRHAFHPPLFVAGGPTTARAVFSQNRHNETAVLCMSTANGTEKPIHLLRVNVVSIVLAAC